MTKVLHLYRTYFPDTQGGLEESVRQMCLATRPLGYEHRILTLSPHVAAVASLDRPEAKVVRAHLDFEIASCGFSLAAVKAYRDLAAWADIIHYHHPWPFQDLLHLGFRPKKPVVISYQSDIVRQRAIEVVYAPVRDRFLAAADRIIATSPDYVATSATLQRFNGKVTVIPNTIDESIYSRPDPVEVAEARRRYGDPFFLFIGVLRYYKGLEYLVRSAAGAPYRVIIAGDGPFREKLSRLKESLGADNVVLAGRITDAQKATLLAACRAIVLPSHLRSEAFGMFLLEGAMFGKPMISTSIGTGTSYINRQDVTGLVVPCADPGALRGAMDHMAADAEAAARWGRAARKRYETEFDCHSIGRRLAAVYDSLCVLRRAKAPAAAALP